MYLGSSFFALKSLIWHQTLFIDGVYHVYTDVSLQCLNLDGVFTDVDVSYQYKAQSKHLYKLVTQFKDFDRYSQTLYYAGMKHNS